MQDEIVTIVGSAYLHPISVLIEELTKNDKGNLNTNQASPLENGFASSICVLSVVLLESYVMRVKYANGASKKDINRTPTHIYLKKLYSDFPFEQELKEIHIVRDILVHNHLWEVKFQWDDALGIVDIASNKRSDGDSKYKECVDASTGLTSKLRLNTSPIKIGASDAKEIIQTVWRILLFLEGKNTGQCYVSHLLTKHDGKMQKFGKIIGLPKTCT